MAPARHQNSRIVHRALRGAVCVLALALLAACDKPPQGEPPPLTRDQFLPAAQADAAERKCREANARLDAPVAQQDSYLQQLAPGIVLRVPKCLYPSINFAKVNEPTEAKSVAMTFWYPDMTLTDWVSDFAKILDIQRGTHVLQKDRFRVKIVWLWHVPADSDSFIRGSKQPPFELDPRPPRIELNRHCYEFVEGRCNMEMKQLPSGLPGLVALRPQTWVDSHPDAGAHRPEDLGTYIAPPSSPYELVMDCSGNAASSAGLMSTARSIRCSTGCSSRPKQWNTRMRSSRLSIACSIDGYLSN